MSTSSVIKVNFCNYIKKKISIHPATDKNIKEKKKQKKKKQNKPKNTIKKRELLLYQDKTPPQNTPETLYLCLTLYFLSQLGGFDLK